MQSIGLLGPAFFLSQLGGVTSATGAVLCMSELAASPAFWCLYICLYMCVCVCVYMCVCVHVCAQLLA